MAGVVSMVAFFSLAVTMSALHRRFVCDLKVISSMAQENISAASNLVENLPIFQNMQVKL